MEATGTARENEDLVTIGWAAALGLIFYALGNFGLLNIFDLRREVQVVLIAIVLTSAPTLVLRAHRWIRSPFWWLTLLTLVAEIFIRRNVSIFFLIDRLMAVYTVALVCALGPRFSNRVLQCIITLAAVFSMMVLLQAIVIWYNPDVLNSFVLGYTTSTQADAIELGHPLEYLGFVVPGVIDIAGHAMPRFRSFASEPSVLICTFLVPGLLALTYRGIVRWFAVPILLFAVGCSGSGTAWLSLAIGGVAYVLLLTFKRWRGFLTVAPFVLVPLWLNFLSSTNIFAFMVDASEALAPYEFYDGAFNKIVSGTTRFTTMSQYFSDLHHYLWGAPFQPAMAVGFLLHMLLYAGVVGLAVATICAYKMLYLCSNVFVTHQGGARLGVALLYGTLVQVFSFSEFGWMTSSGFMLIAILMQRLEQMLAEGPCQPTAAQVAVPV